MKVKMIATGKVEDFNESYARRLYCAGLAVLAEDAGDADGTDGAENASGDSLPGSNPALIFPEGNTPAASDATGADAEPLAGGNTPAADGAAGADAEPLAGGDEPAADGTGDAENASGDSLPGSNPALIFPEGNTPAASDAEGIETEPSEGGEIPASDGAAGADAEPSEGAADAVKTDKPGKGRKSR